LASARSRPSSCILSALTEDDLKRLLACSTIEAVGERNLGRLGGLIHGMPRTALLVLVGAAAIAALPPLNRFVSEWLTFQAILAGPRLPQWELKIGVAIVGAMLALDVALAAACFVRAYGIAFLGRPRSAAAAGAREVGHWQQLAMAVPAGLSVVFGVLPALAIGLLAPATRTLVGAGLLDGGDGTRWLLLAPPSTGGNAYSGLAVLVAIALLSALVVAVIHRGASNRVRRGPAWGCGYPDPGPVAQYTASSLAQPLRRVFGTALFAAKEVVDMPALARHARRASLSPSATTVSWLAGRAELLQALTIRRCLSLMFAALVALLAMVAFA
jgi:NADH:ubiquinone oxidoreductase subunit 5 (subunit L)/multisubunit Na+/H+ antiporter MnhA subunit